MIGDFYGLLFPTFVCLKCLPCVMHISRFGVQTVGFTLRQKLEVKTKA